MVACMSSLFAESIEVAPSPVLTWASLTMVQPFEVSRALYQLWTSVTESELTSAAVYCVCPLNLTTAEDSTSGSSWTGKSFGKPWARVPLPPVIVACPSSW